MQSVLLCALIAQLNFCPGCICRILSNSLLVNWQYQSCIKGCIFLNYVSTDCSFSSSVRVNLISRRASSDVSLFLLPICWQFTHLACAMCSSLDLLSCLNPKSLNIQRTQKSSPLAKRQNNVTSRIIQNDASNDDGIIEGDEHRFYEPLAVFYKC